MAELTLGLTRSDPSLTKRPIHPPLSSASGRAYFLLLVDAIDVEQFVRVEDGGKEKDFIVICSFIQLCRQYRISVRKHEDNAKHLLVTRVITITCERK